MIEDTKFKTIDETVLAAGLDEITKGYLPIRVRSLFPDTVLPFDVYCLAHRNGRSAIRLDKLFPRDRVYPLRFHQHLIQEEFDDAFISCADEDAFTAYLSDQSQKALYDRSLPAEQKAELLYDHAEYIVKKVFRERPSRKNIAIGHQLVTHFSEHALTDPVTLRALLALFSKDYNTFSHCIQVAVYGMCLCRFLGWKSKEIEDFGLGALFHDIGKTAIHEQILSKPGTLDDSEFELIKRHPLLGYQHLKTTRTMSKDQLNIVLHHHEAADGSGYPYGLKAREIHKYACVARIVDIYDALTTERPYKEAFSMQKTLQLMNNQMRHTMDQQFLEAFVKLRELETNTAVLNLQTRLNIEMGTRVQLQLEGRPDPVQGVLAGLEVNRVLMFRVPLVRQIEGRVKPRCAVAGRYRRGDTLYKFRSVVLKIAHQPYALLIVSYPLEVTAMQLRKEASIDCSIRAKAFIGNKLYPGTVTDLSQDGCRVVIRCSSQTVAVDDIITIFADFSKQCEGEPVLAKVQNAKAEQGQVVVDVQFEDLSPATREAMNSLCQVPADA